MLLSIIVGVATGVLSSIVAWLVIYNLMAPNIKFADKIKKEKTKNDKTGYYYQFKFGNLKKRTSAVDIAIRATLYLPEFPSPGVTNMYAIPTSGKNIFELTPKMEGNTGWNRRISLNINDDDFIKSFNKSYFSDEIKALCTEKMLHLEDLLSITAPAFIRVHVSAMDSFSGAKKVFKSREYRLEDVVYGKFERTSLQINAYE